MISRKSVITFGMVAIPIAMYTATQDNDIRFNQLYKKDKSRIRYKKTCANCGGELQAKDIVRGYEYDKNKYVIVSDEELEKIKTEKERSIEILNFVKLDEISPIYYDKGYQAIPEIGGEKAFELLRVSLLEENKIAIGKTVLGTKETLIAIIPREEGMIIQTMHYEDEIKDIQKQYNKPKISKQELDLAKTLINAMDQEFTPSNYKDEYQTKLRELIETKIAGKDVVEAKEEKQDTSNVLDLMDALKASVKKAKDNKETA